MDGVKTTTAAPPKAPPEQIPYPLTKRVFDRLVAALLLFALSPLLLVAFVLLGLDMLFVPRDRGPWFYRERRVTRGREFDVLKFRVLRKDVLAELAERPGT